MYRSLHTTGVEGPGARRRAAVEDDFRSLSTGVEEAVDAAGFVERAVG